MVPDYLRLTDSPWPDQIRRMQRSDSVYKPALLLVVLDMLDAGLARPQLVPLRLALSDFDALLMKAGLLASRGPGRGEMPAFHLSTASATREPFWDLLRDGREVDKFNGPSGLQTRADALRILPDLSLDLAGSEGREAIRLAIYSLLEDDGSPDSVLLLEAHDQNKAEVDVLAREISQAEGIPFVLEDTHARRIESQSARFGRDRAFRRAVLPAYGYSCALCSARLRWNKRLEVEAAHIKPRSERGPDDIRNGLSLCQTHHWAFDVGMWSASDSLRVMVARPDQNRGDDLEVLHAFEGCTLRTPEPLGAMPHPLALEWHRDVRFGRAS